MALTGGRYASRAGDLDSVAGGCSAVFAAQLDGTHLAEAEGRTAAYFANAQGSGVGG